uniref:BZIP domain-containing protein n=1 Tax=Mucochytrium quahogii TaxID=96639 RepID=A0A7S2R844_9STRA|mmetsp:Transcript_7811/g.14432  ORF Transcript_7811/g.14432 Transcript_7811/m.14432 type:complete len:466 (+) Transcript_7811:510-1907(+)|eukprot:CAMPEP_0203758778 /NCGR_PEP_ID=MMETSP0098-20131031/11627_1 /ASSEMBLY_ACC=CAM_ASM_000208 /TAXON_ID=96639 /ORGANISM=" , Strain NY0313808BC1" /LENGTH=465 /DNA_ID=CAMNT_0050651369 /DNA_START=457 /DNA_END=1854 /DNA_ORIENTATION=+
MEFAFDPSAVRLDAGLTSDDEDLFYFSFNKKASDKVEEQSEIETEQDSGTWLKKRREQIARASRKAREKKKNRKVELEKENDRLKRERSAFLENIQNLQLKLAELRNCGHIDIQLENELLRAQLEEHKRFLSGCCQLHHGVPSSTGTLLSINRQSADFTNTYVHSLISRSITENWELGKVKGTKFQHVIPGYNATSCYKFITEPKECLHLRIDFAVRGIGIDIVADVYWSMWTNPDIVRKLYGIDCPFKLKEVNIPMAPTGVDECMRTYSYSEDSVEWVYLASRKREQIVKSTVQLPDEKSPGLVRGLTPKQVEQQAAAAAVQQQPKKRRKGKSGEKKEAAVGVFGKTNGWVFARSTTQHTPEETTGKKSRQRIAGFLIEGLVVWEQEVRNTVEVECMQEDLDPDMCTRGTIVLSIPRVLPLSILKTYNDLIDEEGHFTDRYIQVLDDFFDQCYKLQKERATEPL